MKKLFFVLLSVIFLSAAEAQKINYTTSLESAKALALTEQKPIAVLLTIQQSQANSLHITVWKDVHVINKFNKHFINYKVSREDPAAARIIRDYKIYRFPSLLFLDAKGGLMFTDVAIPRAERLFELADKAIDFKKERSLVDFDSAYQAGEKSTAFLKEYIIRRKNSGITNNADLIETYVNGLSVADLNRYDEVLFILNAGPILDSNAYKLARTNKQITDSIYKTEPLATRVAINNATIQNSMLHAIANNNLGRANAVANFTRSSHGKDYIEGQKSWYLKMMQFYAGVKDTTNYLQQAAVYYERYYMSMSLDSVLRKDSSNLAAARKRASDDATKTFPTNTRDTVIRKTFSFSYSNDAYATELNNVAWNFYKMAGNNNELLLKALLWSKRAVEYSAKPAFYDTYAHLLYKLKFYDEAESMQKKAIESAKTSKADTSGFEKEYKKIKSRTL